MQHETDLEREAYRASWSDGIVDLYVGLSLVWIGIAWIWLEDLAGMAGVLPAIFLAPMMSLRKRVVEPRLGYMQWRGPRRRWERRNLWLVLAAGVGMLLLGVLAFVVVRDTGAGGLSLAPGILAWLLALLGVGLAVLLDAPRILIYATVLAISGTATVALSANPGWPMLLTGVVATIVGGVMLWRFLERYPVMDRQ